MEPTGSKTQALLQKAFAQSPIGSAFPTPAAALEARVSWAVVSLDSRWGLWKPR